MTHRPGPLQIAVAIVVPLLLVAAWTGWVLGLQPPETSDVGEVWGSDTEAIDVDADVILVGNSLTHRGIDKDLIKRELGVKGEVYVLSYAGSWAPAWYAALKNQVYAHDRKPKLIVVVNTLEYMLRTDPPEGRRENDLRALMTEDEPLIMEKVYGNRKLEGPVDVIRTRRGEVGARWMDGMKSWPFALAGSEAPVEEADGALAEIFDKEGATDPRFHYRVLPVVEYQRSRARGVDPSESFLPDLIDLAETHGSRIVFARIPISRSGRANWPVPPLDTERAAVELFNERGAGYVDLHGLPLPDSVYLDDHHLNRLGARAYSTALAEQLQAIGALSDEPMPKAQLPPRPPTVSRNGVGPRLPEIQERIGVRGCRVAVPLKRYAHISDTKLDKLGVGAVSPIEISQDGKRATLHTKRATEEPCANTAWHFEKAVYLWSEHEEDPEAHEFAVQLNEDLPLVADDPTVAPAWWVYPGTDLLFEFEEDEALGEEPVTVEMIALSLGQGEDPTMRVDFDLAETEQKGIRMVGSIETDGAPRSIRIASPADGTWLLVRSLALKRDDGSVINVIGTPQDGETTVRLMGGVSDPKLELDEAGPLVPSGEVVLPSSPTEPWSVPIPDQTLVSMEGLRRRTGLREDLPEGHWGRHTAMAVIIHCSPVRFFEDGVELMRSTEPKKFKKSKLFGAYTHSRDSVFFRPIDGVSAEGHDYSVRLAEERFCRGHLWIYPGDVARISNDGMLGHLHSGADTLTIGGFVIGERAAAYARVQLTSSEGVHLDRDIPVSRIEHEPLELRIPQRVGPMPDDLELKITTPEGGPYLLLNIVSLSDQGRPTVRLPGR